ncbi:hypothetical protein GCM10010498_17880 [Streptomyces cavourensis]|nr:hypothetical protein GCM10010498_17880 [Streptomyces cavourensis]
MGRDLSGLRARRPPAGADPADVNTAAADSSSRPSTTDSAAQPGTLRRRALPGHRSYAFMSIERMTRPGVRHNDHARLTTQ